MTITADFLESGRSHHGAWTRPQLEAIGVQWPPPSRWKREIIGKEITEQQAKSFLNAKHHRPE